MGERAARAEDAHTDADAPVRARGLVKRYGEVLAVDHIDLDVRAGDVYGFLGPNGAGKTTTLRMALGLIVPSEGSVQLFGRDPLREGAAALHGVAGFVEAPRFYPYLTGRKNLELLAALDGDDARSRIEAALHTVELAPRAKHKVGGYSHGMRQRLGIAAALLRQPRLLILDEPATGLDPAGMRDMRRLIRRLSSEGITVLLSSHLLPEVQELCDRVAIVNRGRIVYEGQLRSLRQMAGSTHGLRTSDDARAREIAQDVAGIELVAPVGGGPPSAEQGPSVPTPDAHAPGERTPDAHTPAETAPDAHTPAETAPDAHTPAETAPDAHTPAETAPDAHTPGETAPLRVRGPEHAIGELSLALAAAGVAIYSLTPELATLEDLFFRLTEGAEVAEPHQPAPELSGAL